MGRTNPLRHKQRGAVAIVMALTIVVLVGMVGLVLDLGRVYIAKTELQNAADASALAGAKELNGSLAGVNNAQAKAIEAASKNKFNFTATPVALDSRNLWVGSCPDDDCMVPISSVTSSAAAADKTFLKVDTGTQNFSTWLIHVLPGAPSSVGTFGMAVAGRYVIDVTPLGVCAVDKNRPEDGFIRGVAYNVPLLNPLIINADPLWINPVNAPPDSCAVVDPQWNSRDKMAPFVCTGKSAVVRALPGEVFVNTGASSALEKELNSRFDDYQGSRCDSETAPPDTNIRAYTTNLASDWMDPDPEHQGITITNRVPIDKTISGVARTPPVTSQFADFGVLWAYSHEVNWATGNAHTLGDWMELYKGEADQYPLPSPYAETSGKYFLAPRPSNPGVVGRRIMNLVIIDCSVPEVAQVGPGNKCAALPTLAVGKFFMQVVADLPNSLYLEFGGLVAPPLPPADIRLYR